MHAAVADPGLNWMFNRAAQKSQRVPRIQLVQKRTKVHSVPEPTEFKKSLCDGNWHAWGRQRVRMACFAVSGRSGTGLKSVLRGERVRMVCLAVSVGISIAAIGCVGRPPRVEAPLWEPDQLALQAIRTLDTSDDGSLQLAELRHDAPGLAAGWDRLDQNRDDRVTPSELAARLRLYQEMQTGLRSQSFRVAYQGRPLAGAQVRLVPEPFLATTIEPASGVTDSSGTVIPQAESYDLPAMRLGYYCIEITSDAVRLSPKYNTNSTLGVEISPVSDGDSSSGMISLDLN
jgi:hypothetical protein